MHPSTASAVFAAVLALAPHRAAAQSVEALGTRAAGMSGAFVAVVDDASAVYWNPGALATGAYFSLVLDRTQARTATDEPAAASRSAFLIALAAPALGLSYYRLRATRLQSADAATGSAQPVRNGIGEGQVRLESLVTHHAGATFVQSVTDRVAIGTTLKVVRGSGISGVVPDANRERLLGDGLDRFVPARTTFDVDLGISAVLPWIRAGLTLRNLREPEFAAGNGGVLTLEREARAGVSVRPLQGWTLAADVDLLTTPGPFGRSRELAIGTEARATRRAVIRGGVRLNTLNDEIYGRAPAASLGASFAVRAALLVDGQVTAGSEGGLRGWGIAGRFVY